MPSERLTPGPLQSVVSMPRKISTPAKWPSVILRCMRKLSVVNPSTKKALKRPMTLMPPFRGLTEENSQPILENSLNSNALVFSRAGCCIDLLDSWDVFSTFYRPAGSTLGCSGPTECPSHTCPLLQMLDLLGLPRPRASCMLIVQISGEMAEWSNALVC